jgi:hypothetical protein
LFADLAEHFKCKVEFPPDAIEGIADEQYVRNVVDVLYRTEMKGKRQRAASVPMAEEHEQDAGGTLVP